NSRLSKGGMARVIPGTSPNAIKSEPGTTAKHPTSQKLGEIPVGGVVNVVDGPTCMDGILWWKIEYNDASPKLTGWTGEGQGTSYWMEPVVQTATVTVVSPGSTDSSVSAGSGNTSAHVVNVATVPTCPGFNLTTRLSVGSRARVMAGSGANIVK